jgi:hypothetical protein
MEHVRYLGHHEKTKPLNHGCKKGKDIQTKSNDNTFNRIMAENFPNLEKERLNQVQKVYRRPNNQDQKSNTPRHIIINTLSTQNKERILKVAKEKRQVTCKSNPIRIAADFST